MSPHEKEPTLYNISKKETSDLLNLFDAAGLYNLHGYSTGLETAKNTAADLINRLNEESNIAANTKPASGAGNPWFQPPPRGSGGVTEFVKQVNSMTIDEIHRRLNSYAARENRNVADIDIRNYSARDIEILLGLTTTSPAPASGQNTTTEIHSDSLPQNKPQAQDDESSHPASGTASTNEDSYPAESAESNLPASSGTPSSGTTPATGTAGKVRPPAVFPRGTGKATEQQVIAAGKVVERVKELEAQHKARQAVTERYQKSVAKALPALTAGIRDAVQAFSSGDAIAGSAAIMDICATVATVGGAMSAAGGPPGALIGAFFTVISMILRIFAKQQKALTVQLEEIIRSLESEKEIRDLTVAQQSIGAFIDVLTPSGSELVGPIRGSWTSEITTNLNIIEGASINAIRHATAWLDKEQNQQLPLWGNVLAAQCQAYVSYMYAMTLAVTSLDVTKMEDGRLAEEKLTRAFRSTDLHQLDFLRRIAPAARNRGIVFSISYKNVGQFEDSGSVVVRDNTTGKWKDLKGTRRILAVAKRKSLKAEDANPYLAIFSADKVDTRKRVEGPVFRNRENKYLYCLEGRWPLSGNTGWQKFNGPGPRSIAATPGENELEIYVYIATDRGITRFVHKSGGTFEQDDYTTCPRMTGENHLVDSVCAAAWPQAVEGEETDELAGEKFVVYEGGTAYGKRYIRPYFGGVHGFLRTPDGREVTGMAADRKRFWVFNRDFLACISHADVKRYVKQTSNSAAHQPEAPWSFYELPEEFKGPQNWGPFHGLHDIAPCDDGTLLAVFRHRKGAFPFIYQATPAFDRQARRVIIQGVAENHSGQRITTSGWTLYDTGAMANRVYKLPIFCWSMIERLTKVLASRTEEKPAAGSDKPSYWELARAAGALPSS